MVNFSTCVAHHCVYFSPHSFMVEFRNELHELDYAILSFALHYQICYVLYGNFS